MTKRNLIAGLIVAICLVLLIVYKQREGAEQLAAPAPGSAAPNAPAMQAPAKPTEKVRKIDATARKALQERIAAARTTRTGGGTGPTGATGTSSKAPPPSLPALPGTISKDDIRAGVRAVIPLLAECYDAAKDRLSPQRGQIVVQMHLTGEPEVGTLIDKAEIGGDAQLTADKDLVECLQQTMLSVELPPIAEGGTVDVTYPIAFAPD
jgi:hypothetical protein